MRLSIITGIASLLSIILNSASIFSAPIQPAFQVNTFKGQLPANPIQSNAVHSSQSDPRLVDIANFLSTQKQLLTSNPAPINKQSAVPSASAKQPLHSTENLQAILSKIDVRLTDADTPRQIAPTTSILLKRASTSTQSHASTADNHLQTARHYLNISRQVLQLENPDQELTLHSNRTDNLGKHHLRFHQYYHDIAVWNSALTVHLNKAGDVELVDGMFYPSPKKLSTTPLHKATQAVKNARLWIPLGTNAIENNAPQLVIYPESGKRPRLAWEVKLSAALDHQWLVLVDAHNGTQILAYNQVNDMATTGSGADIFNVQQQLNIFESNNQFFLADTSKSMFQGGSPFPITSETGAIYILDDKNQATIGDDGDVDLPERLALSSSRNRNAGWPQDAVSAAFTLSATYDYYADVHSRNSLDGKGGSIFAVVRVGRNYENAFWNGQVIAFGDAVPFAGALDVVGHELTHGVIQNTANLIYLNQSGALNEAFSDILGEAIEAHTFGQADWVTGGQLGSPLRNLRDPGSLNYSRGRPYPATMSEFVQLPSTPEGDLGGIHINSSIINHAFYLLAEGLNGAIGIDDAEQIFYRALAFHLVPRSRFLDARLAVIQSAKEIYGDASIQAQKAAEAFDAIEIFDAPPTPDTGQVSTISGPDATIFIEFNSQIGSYFLKRRDPALNDSTSGESLSFFEVSPKRPSVDRSTGLIAFIDSLNVLCLISSTNGLKEECLDDDIKINSVAVSSDGEKFAVVFRDSAGQPENKISIIDISTNGQNQTIELVAPATEGASTTTIVNADAMDFTNDGQFLVYDAFNEIAIADGSKIGVWSIYALDLANKTTIALVPPVNGFHFAFPSMSQTTDDYLTFDALNLVTGTNTVTAASLITGETKTINTSDDFGTPSYNGDDTAIVYSQVDSTANTRFSLFRQPLQQDTISPSGSPELWLKNADYGVIYRRGNTITTPPTNPQTVAKEGLWWIPSKPGSGFDIQLTSNNDLFMIWYTYALNGRPLWYLASGPVDMNNKSWSADIFEFTWDGSSAISSSAGSAQLNFQDNTHASLNWTLNTGNGSADIEYFVFDQGTTTSSGTWFDKAQPGYGLTQVNQGSTQVKVLYFYDQAGNPRWALGSGSLSANTTRMDTFSGSCPVCPLASPIASSAGTVTTSFSDQLNGTLSTDIVLPSPLLGTWPIFNATISNLSE